MMILNPESGRSRFDLAEGGEPAPWERVKDEAEAQAQREAEAARREAEADFEAGS
jgi:hypothetical protein